MDLNPTFEEPEEEKKPGLTFTPEGVPGPVLSFTPGEVPDPTLDRVKQGNFMEALDQLDLGVLTPPSSAPETPEEAAKRAAAAQRFHETLTGLKSYMTGSLKLTRGALKATEELSSDIPGIPSGAQVLEETYRIASAPFEQIGTLYSDLTGTSEENNLAYQFGRILREGTAPGPNEDIPQGVAEDFERGLAQTVGFIGGGKLASTILGQGTKTAAAIAAWLGAAVGGQAGREEAKAHGATDWQVDLAYYLDSVWGASEGLPIATALGRIDDMTGGVLGKYITSNTKKVVAEGLVGAVEEGLQELGQTFAENVTAKELAAYDPARPLGENILDAATTGGSVGFLVSLVTSAMGVKNRQLFEEDVRKRVLEPLGLNSLDEIADLFSTIDEHYARIQRQLGRSKEIVAERARAGEEETQESLGAAISEFGRNPVDWPDFHAAVARGDRIFTTHEMDEPNVTEVTDTVYKDESGIKNHFAFDNIWILPKEIIPSTLEQRFRKTVLETQESSKQNLGNVEIHPDVIKTPEQQARSIRQSTVEKFLAKILANKELEGTDNAFERAQKTPVTMALTEGMKRAQGQIDLHEKALNELKASKENIKKQVKLKITTKENAEARIKEIDEDIEQLTFRRNQHRAIIKEEKQMARNLKSLAAQLMEYLPKGSKVLVTNSGNAALGKSSSTRGFFTILPTKDSGQLNLIAVETDRLAEAAAALFQDPENEMRQRRYEKEKISILNTFLHEFGHAIAYNQFQTLYHKVLDGTATKEEELMWRGLETDYMQFVTENLQTTTGHFMSRLFTLPRAYGFMLEMGVRTEALGMEGVEHQLAMDPELVRPAASTLRVMNYLLSMREYFAEEFAKLALSHSSITNPGARKYFETGMKDLRKMLAVAKGKFQSSSPTMKQFFRQHSLHSQLRSAIENMQKNTEQDPLMALAKAGVSDLGTMKRLSEQRDRFNQFMDLAFNILQIAEQNPHIQGLQRYIQHLIEWKNEVNKNLAIAEDRLTEWKNLGRDEIEKLGRLLLDETMGRKPDGGWLAEPRNFTNEEIAAYKLSDSALELRKKIKEDFRTSLDQMEEILVAAKHRIFADNPIEAKKEELKVRKEFSEMKKRPYFPLMRFGEYTLEVRSVGDQIIDGRNYKDGEIIEFQTFDTKRERNKEYGEARKRFNRASVSKSKLVSPNFSLQGMPLTLVEHLESKLVSTGISEEVKEAIRQVKNDVLPFRSFRKQFQRRKRVAGYSLDAQRSYANYMTSFANHIARVKYDSIFKEDFENVNDSIKVINRQDAGDSTKRSEILNHMQEHLQYVMNPVNEFVGLRSAAFFWFLGFNVKSAFVNMSQVPLVTYPYLSQRHGAARAAAQIARASKTAILAIANPKLLDADIQKLVEQGMRETWLDESLATELALAASEKNLDKSLPRKWRQQAWLKMSHYGSLPFHTVEKLNRHLTAIAAYRLERIKKASHEEAVNAARAAVQKTQYEYARWARPKFMRGKVGGTVFVFQNYMQNTLYFALGGDPAALRMLMMLFLVAGLQGLPFGENIMDLVDAGMEVLKRRAGVKDPHEQVRVDLRKVLKDLEINPDLVLHGMSSSSFGLANIGEFMGWPIPNVDLSGSLSLGRVIPGTELLQPSRSETFEKFLAEGVERVGGAAISGLAGIGQALFDANPDQWKRWEKAMPAAMRAVSKAARYAVRGEEATRGGYPIAGFDMHDPQDQGELIAQALGFTPRDVSKGWEGFIAQQQAVVYYETWKSSLLRQWNYAKETKDEEAVKETNAEIREYNSVVPFPEMKIGPDARFRSFQSYMKSRQYTGAKTEQSSTSRRLSSSIQDVFEESENN